jgi:hypothetical protein
MSTLPVVVTARNVSGLTTTANAVINVTDAPASSIPLTYNDPRFASNVAWQGGALPNNAVITQKSYNSTATGDSTCGNYGGGNFTLDRVRINSRECVRVGASGTYLIKDCYLEVNGQGADHADCIQAYAPGATGNLTVRNTCMKASNNSSTTSGMFVADGFSGTFTFENVCFIGGPYGLRIHADAGTTVNVYMTDVFFVGTGLIVNALGTGKLFIRKWQNVRNATIVNGVIVPGTAIAPPVPVTP